MECEGNQQAYRLLCTLSAVQWWTSGQGKIVGLTRKPIQFHFYRALAEKRGTKALEKAGLSNVFSGLSHLRESTHAS